MNESIGEIQRLLQEIVGHVKAGTMGSITRIGIHASILQNANGS
jgi:hypothetical protein